MMIAQQQADRSAVSYARSRCVIPQFCLRSSHACLGAWATLPNYFRPWLRSALSLAYSPRAFCPLLRPDSLYLKISYKICREGAVQLERLYIDGVVPRDWHGSIVSNCPLKKQSPYSVYLESALNNPGKMGFDIDMSE